MRSALLIGFLAVVASGCGKKKSGDGAAPGSGSSAAMGSGSAVVGSAAATGSDSAQAGSAAGSGSDTGATDDGPAPATFAPFVDAMAGTKPWLDDAGKAGVIELHAEDDLSGKTKGRFSVDQRCGAAAVKAVDAVAKQLAERSKPGSDWDPADCTEEPDEVACGIGGLGEGDVSYRVVYRKAGGTWRLAGVETYAVGVTMDAQDAKFAELLAAGPCK